MNRPPDDEGNEHQVWYVSGQRTVIKATWPDYFGVLVVHRANEEPKASPIDYLERWNLHNELFGDAIRFLGALRSDSGLRLLIQQPAIAGVPASDAQIERFFTSSGWRRFAVEGNVAYFDPERQVVISDTHRGNLILMDDGLLAPIDLRVQPVSGSLLDTVAKLCSPSSTNHRSPTAVLQLVWNAIEKLPRERRGKPIHVISSCLPLHLRSHRIPARHRTRHPRSGRPHPPARPQRQRQPGAMGLP